MSSYVDYRAPRQSGLAGKLSRLARMAAEPGVVALIALAILSLAFGIVNPEQAAELALLF